MVKKEKEMVEGIIYHASKDPSKEIDDKTNGHNSSSARIYNYKIPVMIPAG